MIHDASGGSSKYHDAGYDAFATGLCFLGMADRLVTLINTESSKDSSQRLVMQNTSDCLSIAKPFLNKLNMHGLIDIPYLNISGEDVFPNRDHIFHITFPAEWKTGDLLSLFSPSFGHVQVTWLNDTSTYISLR